MEDRKKLKNIDKIENCPRTRDFYSEIITDLNANSDSDEEEMVGSTKKTNFLWQALTDHQAPTIVKLLAPQEKTNLKNAERWMSFEEDNSIEFPIETFKPKVQLQLQVYPFEITRSVATERLRRNYQKINIRDALDKLNIRATDMASLPLMKKYYPQKFHNIKITTKYLPLELFDDEEYECRTPENWLELGIIKGKRNPLPAEAFVPVEEAALEDCTNLDFLFTKFFKWVNAAVMDYDPITKLWNILTMDGKKQIFDLPRIYIMFKGEDPILFAERIKKAVQLRQNTENTLRYKFYLSTIILDYIPGLKDSYLENIYKMATRGDDTIKVTKLWKKLIVQIENSYREILCDLQFRLDSKKDLRLKNYVTVPPKDWASVFKPWTKIKTEMKSFAAMKEYFQWMSIYVEPEVYRAIYLFMRECLKQEELSLFTDSYGVKHITLAEFDVIQTKHYTNVIEAMSGSGLQTLIYKIRMSLCDTGKGWFDLNVNNYEVYEVSKLKRVMELIKHRMQQVCRTLVLKSIEIYINMIEKPCFSCFKCSDDFIWGFDLKNSSFVSKAAAIFTLQLKMNNDGAYYSTNLDNFKETLLKLYDTPLTLMHKINQIHPFLLTKLKFSKNLQLSSIGLLAEEVVDVRIRFLVAYEKAAIPAKAYAKEFNIYLDLFKMDVKVYLETFENENHSASEFKETVSFHLRMKSNIESTIPSSIVVGPFFVTIEHLKHFLCAKRQEIATKLLDMFCQKLKNCVAIVLEEYHTIMIKLSEKPDSIERVFEIRDWIETIPMLVQTQEELVRRYVIEYEVLDHFWYNLPQEDFDNKWEVIGWPYKINKQIIVTNQFLKEEEEKFYKIHLNDEYVLEEKIEMLTQQVVQMSKQKDFSKVHEIAVDVRRVWKLLKDAQEQGQQLNQRQKLFGTPVVPFDNLLRLVKEFEPYKALWITASDWLRTYEMCMDNPLINLDGEAIERSIGDMYKAIVKSVRTFADIEAVQEVAILIRQQIEEFKYLLPVLLSLKNPGMKQRHWDILKESTGVNITFSGVTTFRNCLDFGVDQQIELLTTISDAANKEYSVEQTLDKMIKEWENAKMELNPFKETGTYIVKISDDLQQMLDDHLILTQQISFSPFKGPFAEKIDKWEESLKITSEVIEEWMDVQKQWMYLEPILTSDDIKIQLPNESKKYGSMERTWRRIMRGARDCPYIIKYCADKKLFESLKDANHILEIVQKGLAEYLEIKRIAFPRLYFLSDDELLEILSHSKNPLAVQPHLRKCFENIASLKFEEDLEITQMFSAEQERVDLVPTLYPTANIEHWLLLVENSMKNTIRVILEESLETVKETPRDKWVLEWPGQVVIAASQTFWTAGVEHGVVNNLLEEFLSDIVFNNLNALRNLVKSSLTFLHREILSALIVIEVHARDVTQNLVDSNISNINDFDWISQLRYYWINNDLKVRAVNAEFQYGYEYLGNSGRLVITPLTDRCYLTLTGALHLKFGGAPAGPAGTGKTETTKDLAKAMALQCVVFNCSDQLDFMAMGKFFKGLASSGAWACFDEFNRIDIEVLSVVAQQITTIQKAQQANLEWFMFEGSEIRLKESCAVFITMNPGYAGRTELPDNLKALFRPVAMMVPDYSLISEISLFSFGFIEAKQLANKITTTFKLSSEQLSTQDHYDFGMRAVKTVIAVAGNLKREKPKLDEKQIVLRALRDVNVPKFLKDDLKLFNGIVSDLFPRLVEEPVDYGVLEEAIRLSCQKMGLEDANEFVRKVIQLYETTVVRHGLMLVGPTASGKTKCYEVLKTAMISLESKPQPSGYPFYPVHSYVMNPKSITMGQLYGEFDLQTHEWTDGILPHLIRLGVSEENKHKRWYIFDGPVDAVWIENMNTVLDDNKKLCLSSGEIIKLRDTMTMMFEVADLAVASPATVSRCGMVYLEPSVLGFEPFINCWIKRLPNLAVQYADKLQKLIKYYAIPAIELVRTKLKEVLTSIDFALISKFLRLMDFWLIPLTGKDNKPPPGPSFLALIPNLLALWVIFSTIWSIGCTCDSKSRKYFDKWMRDRMINDDQNSIQFPDTDSVYDVFLHDGGFTNPTADGQAALPQWLSWIENIDDFKITIDMPYSDIEIPTIDSVRNSKILDIVLNNLDNVLCVGPTGTGKTLTVIGKLSRTMPKKFICDFLSFSARTTANQTQDLLDSKLDRRRKGVFGPPILKRQMFFIDDFNMPALEVYGAQPPIELIRQFMDFGGWYDRRMIGEFRHIIDTNFCVAMGPPEGGRNPVTPRLLRHFHYIVFNEMNNSSKRTIFGTILKFWMERIPKDGNLNHLFDPILDATLKVFNTISQELLPTPTKTHYTFNLRDLSKVFQGVLMFNPEKIENIAMLVRLWYHESSRVFQDRLINDEDRSWFSNLLYQMIENDFSVAPFEILGNEVLLYGDFMDTNTDIRQYRQITDHEKLNQVLEHYLNEYNDQSTCPMKLVLFSDAISHICRISRIIRQPLGNALLLGVGGSGRQSLTRLATYMAEFICTQIEINKTYGLNEWRDDIKSVMLKAGLYKRETVFLFSDTQIKLESFLEDLNNILNSGDVPNIYQIEELDKIYQEMKGVLQEQGLVATKSNLFSAYQKCVKTNLHTVITMSPIGDIFRTRLRQFPALVNCCTIDWFSEWPDSALQSVALQFLDDLSVLDLKEEIIQGIVITCQFMHASVVNASILYKQELSRHNYVTPTSYLELLRTFTGLMLQKRNSLNEGVGRLYTGLEKLQNTAEEVKILQISLEEMRPALLEAAEEAETMIDEIGKDQLVAEETKAIVEKEEILAAIKALETQTIAEDAQRDLDEAMPDLLAAESSLKTLNKNDISEVRSMKRPPAGVVFVIETICIVKGIKPRKIPGNMPGEKIIDYWEPGRNMLADSSEFLSSLLNFDKDSITQEMIDKLKPYITNPQFQPGKVAKVSKACKSLCMWVHAMYKYFFVNQRIAPKKATLAIARMELEKTEAILADARKKLQIVADNLCTLQEKLNEKIKFKEEKEKNIQICQERMSRAVRLINGLSDERVRWLNTISTVERNSTTITGDILLSAGAVAYLSPFTDKYRRGLLSEWIKIVQENNIQCSADSSPVSILAEPAQIRIWHLNGLPRDYFSTENAVFVLNSKRWPLFIDPQGQANKWIKNMEKSTGLSICKMTDKELLRHLESSVRFGKPVLIEGIDTYLHPALDPILLRQKFKQAGNWMLKVGDVVVPYDDNFRLFMTTKLSNPHYTPEVSIKVLIVNFTLVPSGLQDQLLALVVMQERPDLEEQRSEIVVSSAQMKQELKEIQDRILYKLSSLEGSPLNDLDFIITLESSKVKSDDIKNKVVSAEITQIDIDHTRAQYIPVANRAQILFFCLSDLSNVDPMYQYSLEWFIKIFTLSMAETLRNENIVQRVQIINDYFTFSLYCNVCRSLFEKHKLLFAFLMSVRILMNEGRIDGQEWHYFLAGGSKSLEELMNPAPEWLSNKSWKEISALEILPNFAEIVANFPQNKIYYRKIFESVEPHKEKFPEEKLTKFQKILILKCLRPDKVINAMQDFISYYMGDEFIEPQTANLAIAFKDSNPATPLIFVLSAGTDPAADLYKFAETMKFTKRMLSISLGQGQGPIAEKMLQNGCELGFWVFFQNCHLAPSWMPRLERLIENISPEVVHRDFRIWLTSTPSPHFPTAILQNGSKITIEPPAGIKANIKQAYTNQVFDLIDTIHGQHEKNYTFKWLLFSLCFFHGVVLERRKFGPLGFNIPYEFTAGDLKISISQLKMFLWEYNEIPFKVLTYTTGNINYGGRVTDDWDRRCLMNILADYYNPDIVDSRYTFDANKLYHQLPPEATYYDYLDYIKTFPINDNPEVFGLHQNADITFAQSQTYSCLSILLTLQPKEIGGAAVTQEEVLATLANNILNKLPNLFDLETITQKYPVSYEESLNTVLIQESIRYNNLLITIQKTLQDLLKAIKGLVVMSEVLEAMAKSLYSNLVPLLWANKAYPSLKLLGEWVEDLRARCNFLTNWILNGIPISFWLSGFFFPQAFLTATLQNFARKYIVSIDTINFSFKVLDTDPSQRPDNGCCIYGLFLEGARWNSKIAALDESNPKELYTEMPTIYLLPEENHQKILNIYESPVYKTLSRAGVLSTTGHSTNYVVTIEIPSTKPQSHWIKRGVALICALDY